MKFLLIVMLLAISCSNESAEPENQSSSLPAEVGNQDLEETFQGKTCTELEIPSWDRVVESLVDNRCVRCHNENFAWNGVQLQTYELVKENEELAIQRLARGEFSFDISILEIMTLESWFGAGLPRTEEDCEQP